MVWQASQRRITGARPLDGDPPGSDPRMASPPPAAERLWRGAAQLAFGSGLVSPEPPAEREVRRRGPRRGDNEVLPSVRGTKYLSADGRHVLVSERVADERQWEKYRWRIFDLRTSRPLGSVMSHFARAAFVVADTVLVFDEPSYVRLSADELQIEPLKLRAVDLTSGAELWQQAVRDTTFRGPFPP